MASSWRDFTVKLVLPFGLPEMRLLTGDKIGVETGAGAEHFMGFGEMPIDTIRKGNKPKFTLDGMDFAEAGAAAFNLGGIGGFSFQISIVASRPGYPSRRLRLKGCQLGEGTKILEGDEGGGKGALGGPCMDIDFAFGPGPMRSIYARVNGR